MEQEREISKQQLEKLKMIKTDEEYEEWVQDQGGLVLGMLAKEIDRLECEIQVYSLYFNDRLSDQKSNILI